MKLLVIGIDGGTRRIIDALNMPYLQSVIKSGVNLNVKEDLWSRGWVEILSGRHGRETGAFYYKPKIDGTHDTTSLFGTKDHEAVGLKPLWSVLNKMGHSTAFMNVPTTMPAPKTKGFFVSGAGGGYNLKEGMKSATCYPDYVFKLLRKIDYPLQVRFTTSGIRNVGKFMDAVVHAIQLRGKAFVDLCRRYQPEFGFLVQSENTPVQNLAMVEVEELIKLGCSPSNYFQKRILEFYNQLDLNVRHVVNSLEPEYLILVSDHGASPRLTNVNLNAFLVQLGLQKRKRDPLKAGLSVTGKFSNLIPKVLKSNLKHIMPNLAVEMQRLPVDWDNTMAFGARYIPGIYINDNERFGGPVKDGSQRKDLITKLIYAFNESAVAQKNDMQASIYRDNFPECEKNPLLPEVWIEHPDTVFFEEKGPFVAANNDYHAIKSLKKVKRSLYTGIKGRKPLACIDAKLKDVGETSSSSDLTQIYEVILKAIQK